MKSVLYRKLWVEYEFGQEDLIFENEEDAITWLKEVIDGSDITFEELEAGDLFYTETLTVWKPSK